MAQKVGKCSIEIIENNKVWLYKGLNIHTDFASLNAMATINTVTSLSSLFSLHAIWGAQIFVVKKDLRQDFLRRNILGAKFVGGAETERSVCGMGN